MARSVNCRVPRPVNNFIIYKNDHTHADKKIKDKKVRGEEGQVKIVTKQGNSKWKGYTLNPVNI
jgi:hypothetical protein